MITDKDEALRESILAERRKHLTPGGWFSYDFEAGFERGFDAAWEWAMDAAITLATQPYQHGLGWEASVEAIRQARMSSLPTEEP